MDNFLKFGKICCLDFELFLIHLLTPTIHRNVWVQCWRETLGAWCFTEDWNREAWCLPEIWWCGESSRESWWQAWQVHRVTMSVPEEPINKDRTKLETPMAPATLCKPCRKSKHGETRSKTNYFKSQFSCILEASESTRMRMEEFQPNYHEDHIAGKGDNSLQLKGGLSSSSGQEWENWQRFWRGTWRKSEVKKRWSMKQGRRAQKFIFCLTDGHMSSEKCWIGDKAPKVQRSSCAPRWYCERQFRLLCSIHWARIFSISNDRSKSHGYHRKTTRMRRTSSGCSICSYPGNNGRCSKIIEKSNSECPDIWISSTTTQMVWIMVQYGRPSRSSWTKSVRSSFGRTVVGKAIWENPIETWLGENSNWECSFVHREKGLFLSVYVDDIKLAGKKENLDPMWKLVNKEVDLGEPTSSVDHVFLACTQRQCEIRKDIVDNYRTMFESRISAGATEKFPCLENLRISSWYGRCQEMCETTLFVSSELGMLFF